MSDHVDSDDDSSSNPSISIIKARRKLMRDTAREALRRRLNWDWEFPKDLALDGEYADVVLTALELEEGNSDDFFKVLWEDVPEFLRRNHKGIALYFVRHDLIDPDLCPCLLDRALMKQQLENDFLIRWRHLPTEFKDDPEFARSIEKFHSQFPTPAQ